MKRSKVVANVGRAQTPVEEGTRMQKKRLAYFAGKIKQEIGEELSRERVNPKAAADIRKSYDIDRR
jgi:hypothetical protein